MFYVELVFCHFDRELFRNLGLITTLLLAKMVTTMLLNSVYLGILNGKIGEVMVFVSNSFISVLAWYFLFDQKFITRKYFHIMMRHTLFL